MNSTDQGYYEDPRYFVCDICGEDNGKFDPETGNHPVCEENVTLREQNVTLQSRVDKFHDFNVEIAKQITTLTAQLKAAREDAERLANSLEPIRLIYAQEPLSASESEYFERGLSLKKVDVHKMQVTLYQHEALVAQEAE
jgi:hypothetical protein